MVDCANRMQLKARGSARGDIITVDVPPMRSDVLHECDVVGMSLSCCHHRVVIRVVGMSLFFCHHRVTSVGICNTCS